MKNINFITWNNYYLNRNSYIEYYYEKIKKNPKLEKDKINKIENSFYPICKTTSNVIENFLCLNCLA
jgi:hypothetical protein